MVLSAIDHSAGLATPARILRLAGFDIPGHYGDPDAEYEALRDDAGLFDRTAWGRLLVTGEQPARWLNGILSNNFVTLAPDAGCRALLLTGKGRIAGDLRAYSTGDGILLETAFDAADGLLANLRRMILFGDRIDLVDRRPETAQLTVQGPAAARVIHEVTGTDPAGLALWQTIPAGDLRIAAVELGEAPAYDLFAPRAEAAALWQALARGARPVGWQAAEMARLAAGLPRWGAELTAEALPLEMGLGEALAADKGCYPGQEIVARMRAHGALARQLRSLAVEGGALPPPDAVVALSDDERPVGRVTSAVDVPGLGVRALAIIKTTAGGPGTRLRVARGEGGWAPAVMLQGWRGEEGWR